MTAKIVPFTPGGRGHGPQRVVALHDDLVEPWAELDAIAGEADRFASGVVDVARRIQTALAAGSYAVAAMHADRLERAGPQQQGRAKRAQVLAKLRQAELDGGACLDGIVAPGHGRAA